MNCATWPLYAMAVFAVCAIIAACLDEPQQATGPLWKEHP